MRNGVIYFTAAPTPGGEFWYSKDTEYNNKLTYNLLLCLAILIGGKSSDWLFATPKVAKESQIVNARNYYQYLFTTFDT